MIRSATGAHIMLIHHTGEDVSRGARGSSTLRAGIDTEIELTRDELGKITAEVTKQRDGPTGGKFAFTLRQVELGEDQDGDTVTTCIVEPTGLATAGLVAMSDSVQKALNILEMAISKGGKVIRKPQYPGDSCVPVDQWRSDCTVDGGISNSSDFKNRERTFRKALNKLVKLGMITECDDLVWSTKP